MTPSLSLTFTPPRIADERALRFVEQTAEHFDLAREQPARGRGQDRRRSDNRRVRAVRSAERVVDVDVAQLHQVGREGRVVRFFAGVEAQVLDHCDRAGLETLRNLQRLEPGDLGRQLDRRAEELAQPFGDGRQRVLRVGLALRPPEMGAAHDRGAALAQPRDRRQRRGDPEVVVDHPVVQRHVEIGAQQARACRAPTEGLRVAEPVRPSDDALFLADEVDEIDQTGSSSPTRCRTSRAP